MHEIIADIINKSAGKFKERSGEMKLVVKAMRSITVCNYKPSIKKNEYISNGIECK